MVHPHLYTRTNSWNCDGCFKSGNWLNHGLSHHSLFIWPFLRKCNLSCFIVWQRFCALCQIKNWIFSVCVCVSVCHSNGDVTNELYSLTKLIHCHEHLCWTITYLVGERNEIIRNWLVKEGGCLTFITVIAFARHADWYVCSFRHM